MMYIVAWTLKPTIYLSYQMNLLILRVTNSKSVFFEQISLTFEGK